MLKDEAKRLYENGKLFLINMDTKEAIRALTQSYNKSKSSKVFSYLLYAYLLDSDYRSLTRAFSRSKENMDGMSYYVLYWYKFMVGELDEVERYLGYMLDSDNYFLRAFGLKELYKRRKIDNKQETADRYLKAFGLVYDMNLEEYRASILLDMLFERYNLALMQIRSLVRDNPVFTDTYLDLMEVLAYIDNQKTVKEILHDPIIRAKADKDYRLAYLMSRELYRKGEYAESKALLLTLTDTFRNNPVFFHNLANVYMQENDYIHAIECYKQAIVLAPLFERAYYNLATIYLRTGYLRDAIRTYEEAVRIHKRPDTLYNLSVSLIEARRLEEAYKHLHHLGHLSAAYRTEAGNIKNQIREAVILG